MACFNEDLEVLHIYKQAFNIWMQTYLITVLSTSQLPTLLIACPIYPLTCQPVILYTPQLPILSHRLSLLPVLLSTQHIPTTPLTSQSANQSSYPPLILPNLNINCSAYPSSCRPINTCQIFNLT